MTSSEDSESSPEQVRHAKIASLLARYGAPSSDPAEQGEESPAPAPAAASDSTGSE